MIVTEEIKSPCNCISRLSSLRSFAKEVSRGNRFSTGNLQGTGIMQCKKSCALTSRLPGVNVKALLTGSCRTSLRCAGVLAPPMGPDVTSL